MKKVVKILLVIVGLAIVAGIGVALLTPWMDRWGATDEEIAAVFPGDELVPDPASVVNRAVTINASPEQIYPWLIQLGAGKGGWYSYSWLETNMLRCPITNADRIQPEWQDLKVGDEVKMCPDEFGPPPYIVAQLHPNRAMIIGHQENGEWVEAWQLVIVPQLDGTSRLVQRTRTMMDGGFWTVIHPGVFVMERGMMQGIKERAESLANDPFAGKPLPQPISQASSPTPEIYHRLDPSPTPSGSDLPLTCQITDLNVYIERAAGYCFAYPARFTLGDQPSDKPSVLGPALGSPAEPIQASLTVEVSPFDPSKTLDQHADEFLKGFTVVDPAGLNRQTVMVGGEAGLMVEPVPAQLSWRIVFVQHEGSLFRLMYWPVDAPEAKTDLDDLYQTTLNSFAFIG